MGKESSTPRGFGSPTPTRSPRPCPGQLCRLSVPDWSIFYKTSSSQTTVSLSSVGWSSKLLLLGGRSAGIPILWQAGQKRASPVGPVWAAICIEGSLAWSALTLGPSVQIDWNCRAADAGEEARIRVGKRCEFGVRGCVKRHHTITNPATLQSCKFRSVIILEQKTAKGFQNLQHGCTRNRRSVNSLQHMGQLLILETVRMTIFLVKEVTLTFLDNISPECLETTKSRESIFSSQTVWECESVEC